MRFLNKYSINTFYVLLVSKLKQVAVICIMHSNCFHLLGFKAHLTNIIEVSHVKLDAYTSLKWATQKSPNIVQGVLTVGANSQI